MEDLNVPQLFTVDRVQPVSGPMKFVPTGNKLTFIWGQSCCGQKKDGPQTAPPLVCTEEFIEKIVKPLGWQPEVSVVHQIFKPSPPDCKAFQPVCVSSTCTAVAEAAKKAREAGTLPVMIGGDHCLSMGSVLGASQSYGKEGFCVIWFDAHADMNTVETSPTGNMHGMPVAALMGLPGMKSAPGFSEGEFTCLAKDRVGWIGLRDVDSGEEDILASLGVETAYRMHDLQKMGMKKQVQVLLDKINPNRDLPIHVSFDVDGMDPIDAPSTGTPVDKGVRLHEALEMLRLIRETGLLASIDIVEVNPSLGTPRDAAITIESARWVIATAIGTAPSATATATAATAEGAQ